MKRYVQQITSIVTKTFRETTRCKSMKCGFQTTDGAPEQFVLERFHTAPFCCVIASDKLEKCVHSVVLLSSICGNLCRTKSIRGWH